jgi:predicted small secreted protein
MQINAHRRHRLYGAIDAANHTGRLSGFWSTNLPEPRKVQVMRKNIIAKLALAALLLSAAGTISACNTIGGVGEDVSAVGKGVTTGAEKTQDKM